MKTGWKMLPFETAVHSRGSGNSGLPTKQWLTVGKFPVIGQGAEDIEGWTDREDLLLTPTPSMVLYGGHTRRAKHVSQPFVPGPNVKILQPVPEVDSKFLYYFLTQLPVESKGYADHFPLVRKCDVPVPPRAEQQRIVGLLDETFLKLAKAKKNAEKNLQNARALFESQLQSVFTTRGPGWVDKKVSELAKHSLGKMLDKAKNKGDHQPYLRNINVRWFTFDLSDLLEMPFLPNEADKYTAVKGDVLICEGGYPGRAAIWNEDYPIYFQKALHRVRFHQPELNKWFVYYLSLQDSIGRLKKYFSGTGIQHFTGEALARFLIPVPPLPELMQAITRFDALMEETQRLARIYQQKLEAFESFKKSILHEAFAGNL